MIGKEKRLLKLKLNYSRKRNVGFILYKTEKDIKFIDKTINKLDRKSVV